MRCHDILGIKETATPEIINLAYHQKVETANAGKDVLGIALFEAKISELENAKKECFEWISRSPGSRLKERSKIITGSSSNDVRLNEFCCGPCTFTDVCCAAVCSGCCSDVEVSCFYTMFQSQAVPIIADLIIYAYWGWNLFKKWQVKQEQQEREYRIQQAERARTENVHLEEQLARCKSEQKNIQDTLREEEKLNNAVVAHIAMFSAFGTTDLQPIYDNQQKRVQAKRDALEKSRKRERELQDKISSNQRTINAGH